MRQQALLPATEEMRDYCALLTREMLHWPGVKMYHLFGTCAFYHRKSMFAMLPDKRSLDSANAICFKTASSNESASQDDWQTFELTNLAMVSTALASLEQAYRGSTLGSALPALAVSR